ncbi:hypothetical protein ABZP36_009791 [Zizania latifolia]
MASGADRIGALPDEVLHHVLSFLPAHEAVWTCLLGRRWRHLWRSAPALRVTGVRGCEDPRWFVRFVDNLLLCRHPRRAPRLLGHRPPRARLRFQPDFLSGLREPRQPVAPSRAAVPSSGARARVLRLSISCHLYTIDWLDGDGMPFRLPDVPIISQHLTRLHLDFVALTSSALDLSGCPALVDLSLKRCEIFGNLSSPSLKHLTITEETGFQVGPFRVRIYAPNLVSLDLSGFTLRTPILGSMPLLVSATVKLTWWCSDICESTGYGDRGYPLCSCNVIGADDGRGESILLKGLSDVTVLDLSVHSEVFAVNRDIKLNPTFWKLKTLLLSEWCPGSTPDLELLTFFLQHSPVLEKLTIHISKVPKPRVKIVRSYEPLDHSFACTHLKAIVIKFENVDLRVQRIFDILITYDIPLELVNFQ